MTPDEINRLAAEKVLVWAYVVASTPPSGGFSFNTWLRPDSTACYPLPDFYHDIAAAWLLIEKLSERFHWRIDSPFDVGDPWLAGVTPLGISGWNGRPDFRASGPTFPAAITLAALKAMGIDVEANDGPSSG